MNTEEVVKGFLGKWRTRSEYLGVVLTGSRATGTSTDHSDVDLLVVLAEEAGYKERGNRVVDGVVLEYIAYPVGVWRGLFDDEVKKSQRMWVRMWRIGRVIEDKGGEVGKLMNEAFRAFDARVDKLAGEKLEMAKYQLWDGLENLNDLAEMGNLGYKPAYYLLLSKLISTYAQFMGVTLPAVAKWGKYFQDEGYQMAYRYQRLGDEIFAGMVLKSMDDPKIGGIGELTNYVLDKLGGFKIDGWKLRESL